MTGFRYHRSSIICLIYILTCRGGLGCSMLHTLLQRAVQALLPQQQSCSVRPVPDGALITIDGASGHGGAGCGLAMRCSREGTKRAEPSGCHHPPVPRHLVGTLTCHAMDAGRQGPAARAAAAAATNAGPAQGHIGQKRRQQRQSGITGSRTGGAGRAQQGWVGVAAASGT